MNQNIKLTVVVAAFSLLFVTCTKDNDNANPLITNSCDNNARLKVIQFNNEDNQQFIYNSNCQIFEYMQPLRYEKYYYGLAQQLDSIDVVISYDPLSCFMQPGATNERYADPRKAKPGQRIKFEYDTSGKISKKSTFLLRDGIQELYEYETFTYLNNRVETVVSFNQDNSLRQKSVYEYAGENVSKISYYFLENGSEQLSYFNKYFYDNKKNPLKILAINGKPGIYTNQNNILIDSSFSKYNETPYVTTYTYEYDSLNYPVKVNNSIYVYN